MGDSPIVIELEEMKREKREAAERQHALNRKLVEQQNVIDELLEQERHYTGGIPERLASPPVVTAIKTDFEIAVSNPDIKEARDDEEPHTGASFNLDNDNDDDDNDVTTIIKTNWRIIAEKVYLGRSASVADNFKAIRECLDKYPDEFAPLLYRCLRFEIILVHMFGLRLGLTAKEVDWTKELREWSEEDCRRVGRSMSTIMRNAITGTMATYSWARNYPQLLTLYVASEPFEHPQGQPLGIFEFHAL